MPAAAWPVTRAPSWSCLLKTKKDMEKKQNTPNPEKNMELPSKAVGNFFEQAKILKVWLANNELAANTRIGRFN
jgi:hypothetical protein